jgi:hypothetical protein
MRPVSDCSLRCHDESRIAVRANDCIAIRHDQQSLGHRKQSQTLEAEHDGFQHNPWRYTAVCKVPRIQNTPEGHTDMRAKIAHLAILIASLLGSTLMAVAQTGEFVGQVPGPIVHDAWEIQDQLQNARSGAPARSARRTTRSYDGSNPAKPAEGGVVTINGTKGEGNRRTP